ncbi:serine/threonine protein kinase [Verticillium nonalfalfae]|uniref:non-specific serine/threonine protein kinase n=1 Tax=Verticillium nonalfalfae TaxID=1051616 RepID=A0A3M9Y5V6_9PEZI|nr:serine/threonine protein kinase [Verticillium nonalfalfae]RNJ55889.1 serine/threonine protein kinase [Verticillium nonalfalfae]
MAASEADVRSQGPESQSQDPNNIIVTQPDEKKDIDSTPDKANPGVHFAPTVEEIAPAAPTSTISNPAHENTDAISEVMSDQLKELTTSLQATNLQGRRLSRFAFDPYSLPASRVPSHEDESAGSTRLPTPSRGSPHLGPAVQQMQSPPLTPSGTDAIAKGKSTTGNDTAAITPQASTSHDGTSPHSARRGTAPRSTSSDQVPQGGDHGDDTHQRSHRRGLFDIGPGGSTPVSRESSPSRASQFYSKPLTPQGDANDPYAANKRQPLNKFTDRNNVESRFQFSKRKPGQHSPSSSTTSLVNNDKRHSTLFGGRRHHREEIQDSDSASMHAKQGSFADLKRFFKKGNHHKAKRDPSQTSQSSGTRTPPASRSGPQRQPFGDDHGLISKYGKLGKVLGSGAGGKVRLMKRHDDGVVFAVKEFRERYGYETQKEYVKRLTAEFCVGSTLHHGNIIETLDILQEKERWYQVMEYAPYDLFAIVMTGKMSRAEITCCFLQILNGVTYLHSSGLAHRDLKLDNVVVSDKGIMKIIDFGSSHVFKYPFESSIIKATGIVGSDPYLAPEVLTGGKYDAEAVDIWSLAIIFCCMSLRRFPWKVPKMTDNSFKLFAAEPTPGHDPKKLVLPSRSMNDLSNTPARDFFGGEEEEHERKHHHHHHHGHSRHTSRTEGDVAAEANNNGDAPPSEKRAASPEPAKSETAPKPATIRGPWRVLRVLPRESRHVISRMLQVDPRERAKMEEILKDPWIGNSDICQQFGPGGEVKLAEGHTHILEFPQPQPGN